MASLFRWNTDELKAGIRRALLDNEQKALAGMTDVSHFLRGETQKRTPIKEGFLTSDVTGTVVRYKSSYAAVVFIPVNSTSASYAIPLHENKYSIGTLSRRKMLKTGKPVGRKYMTRALDDNRNKIVEILKWRLQT